MRLAPAMRVAPTMRARSAVVGAPRRFSSGAEAGYDKALISDIAVSLALGTAFGGVWMVWATGQFSKMDTFNAKVRAVAVENLK